MDIANTNVFVLVTASSNITPRTLSANVLSALQGVRFIAQHIRDADKDNEVNCVLCRHYFFQLIPVKGVPINSCYFYVAPNPLR